MHPERLANGPRLKTHEQISDRLQEPILGSSWPTTGSPCNCQRHAHNPVLIDAGFLGRLVNIPWWSGRHLRLEIM